VRIGIIESLDFSDAALTELQKLGEVSLFDEEKENLLHFVADKEVIFLRLKYFISHSVLTAARNLKIICTPTTGLNHVDVNSARARGIEIISLKNDAAFLRQIKATPEHSFGLGLALLRNYKSAFLRKGADDWDRDRFRGFEIAGMSAGIIGYGRVGSILSGYLRAFGATTTIYDIDNKKYADVPPDGNFTIADNLASLIRDSEMIFLCASYVSSEKILGAEQIDLMADKYFVNTARGELVDENALIHAIEENKLKGVALDVISDEQQSANNLARLVALTEGRNLILTPHIGGATYTSMWKTEIRITEMLKARFESGKGYWS
jgi:D-3-phosphoglycerate dehydrogenase